MVGTIEKLIREKNAIKYVTLEIDVRITRWKKAEGKKSMSVRISRKIALGSSVQIKH